MEKEVYRGSDLTRDIVERQCDTPALWWLGHCGFAIKWRSAIFFIDPYLSNSQEVRFRRSDRPHNRLIPPPITPNRTWYVDLVLITHAHQAHLDPGTTPMILQMAKSARIVLPWSAAGRAHSMGIDYLRMTTMDAGHRLDYIAREGESIRITAIPSAHESLDWSEKTGYPYLGYVLQMGGFTIYHAGDCAPYDGLAERLSEFRIDVALLPINGRDTNRGMPGNFTIHEAAELAEQAGIGCVVPMHYGMFAVNDVDIDAFVNHMLGHRPGVRFKVFEVGEAWMPPAREPA